MPSEAVLAFDTSGSWCAVALLAGDRILAHRHEFMARGQGERLFAVIAEAMQEAGVTWTDLAAIGVGTGPGNFTGIRIGVAAARGLALGLGIQAIGIDRFAALSLGGPSLPALAPSARGLAWIGRPGAAPEQIDPARLSGRVIADPAEFPALAFTATAPAYSLAVAIARLTGRRRHTPQPRPAPLYLRPADAAPASDGAPALLD